MQGSEGGPSPERVAELAARLVEAVRDLAVTAVEGSFKMSAGSLLTHRMMIGVDLARETHDRILDRLKSLGMPSEFLAPIAEAFPAANLVLFGFEDGSSDCLYKFYLEFWDRLVAAVNAGDLAPAPIHRGFKWAASTGERIAVTSYQCFPMIPWSDALERIRSFHSGEDARGPLEAVEAILAAARGRSDSLVYLEGTEDESPRRSYDVNLYSAGLKLGEVRGALDAASRHFAISPARFDRLMEAIEAATLGHISGGRGRGGEFFLTFYYDNS